MDRTLEPQTAPGGPATAEEPQQRPLQAPAEPSGFQQLVQPTPTVAQPTGLGAVPDAPPIAPSYSRQRSSFWDRVLPHTEIPRPEPYVVSDTLPSIHPVVH